MTTKTRIAHYLTVLLVATLLAVSLAPPISAQASVIVTSDDTGLVTTFSGDAEEVEGDTSNAGDGDTVGSEYDRLGPNMAKALRRSQERVAEAEQTGGVLRNRIVDMENEATARQGTAQVSGQLEAQFRSLTTSLPNLDTSRFRIGDVKAPSLGRSAPKLDTSLDMSSFRNMTDLVNGFYNQESVDAKVAGAAAIWANQVAAIKAPELSLKDLNVPELELPAEALTFGLVYQQALASFASNTSVLEQIQGGQLNSKSMMRDWESSIAEASKTISTGLGQTLPSPCYGSFIAGLGGGVHAIASGDYGSDCSACASAGVYMNREMRRLLDPGLGSQYYDPDDNVITPADFMKVPTWFTNVPMADDERAPYLWQVKPPSYNYEREEDCIQAARAAGPALDDVLRKSLPRLHAPR